MRSFLLYLFLFALPLSAQKPDGTLPVELVYFQGYFADGKVILFWGTATEVNNYGFNVERKLPQTDWTTVGFVFGSGNSNSPKSYYFEDSTDLQQAIYHYRLKQIDNDGVFKHSDSIEISTITKIENEHSPIPGFSLEQNFPNPFNPTTSIQYSVVSSQHVSLKIFNTLGKEIATLVNEQQGTGNYSVIFDATNNRQLTTNSLPSGVYFYQLRAGKFVETKKFILSK